MTDQGPKGNEADVPEPPGEGFTEVEAGRDLSPLLADADLDEETPEVDSKRLRLPVIPLRGTVIFPAVAAPIAAGRDRTLRAIETATAEDGLVFAVTQNDAEVETPDPDDLYRVGTVCRIAQMQRVPGGIQMVVQGQFRGAALEFAEREGQIEVVCRRMDDMEPLDEEEAPFSALYREVRQKATDLSRMRGVPQEVVDHLLGGVTEPGELADLVAFYTDLEVQEKQALLETLSVEDRLRKLLVHLQKQIDRLEAQEQIRSQVQEELGERQREVYLREQLKAIQKELGEDAAGEEIQELRERIEALDLPDEAREEAERELRRLERVSSESAEAQVIRTYLETVADLPWSERTEDRLDLERAEEILDRDHHGLDDVKDRVLDFLAVRKLQQQEGQPSAGDGSGQPEDLDTGEAEDAEAEESAPEPREPRRGQEDDRTGSTLLFVGPPGVGKTSIAKSIAEAMNREYVRVSLGGARDEADIRGHRRTYVGALPGRIIEGIKRAGTKNPVFLLDEVDKLGVSFQGDPSAALMEVLDPAQNDEFVDHYLGVPFDLSEVLFIGTANVMEQIPGPLRDRMESIEFRGYTVHEKLAIARNYLLPRQRRQAGLREDQIRVSDDAIREIITSYTREAGVRNLERELGTLTRRTARKVAGGETGRVEIDQDDLADLLGQPKVHPEEKLSEDTVGVATGMYYTPAGGDIMLVEASIMDGKDELVLTGQLGDVMKESARAALTYARSHATELEIPEANLKKREIHVHVPAGAVPKEGPSAGLAMAVALVSALSGRPVRHDVALTGEMTLNGRVLPIGGVKEKVLGAYRAGIEHIVLPAENEGSLEDLPEGIDEAVEFHLVSSLDEVIRLALAPEGAPAGAA
jgi:ATP-dependent Lon protease